MRRSDTVWADCSSYNINNNNYYYLFVVLVAQLFTAQQYNCTKQDNYPTRVYEKCELNKKRGY